MELRYNHRLRGRERDAGQDYPESHSQASFVHLRAGAPGSGASAGAGGRSTAARECSSEPRWLLLKRPENLTEKQEPKLAELLQCNLRSVRGYLLKEDFQFFWDYISPYWAGQFLDRWCTRTMRSKIEPMKRIARMLRAHRPLLLNWFRARGAVSAASVEGFNSKAKLTLRKSYGFRTYRAMEIALYHALGALPEPRVTHKFC